MTERGTRAEPLSVKLEPLPTKLLYVEDDLECREMLAEMFERAGFDVTAAESAEGALSELEAAHFDIVVTDYNLTGKTGAWLLSSASAKGLLTTTPAIVLTSERTPAGVEGYRVLRKPIPFATLLAALGAALGELPPLPVTIIGAPPPTELELVLYVTRTSQDSQTAIRNVHRALKPFDPSRFLLTIVDVSAGGDDAWYQSLEEDHVIVTPTLVRKKPGPKTWVLGNLSPGDAVQNLLVSTLGEPVTLS